MQTELTAQKLRWVHFDDPLASELASLARTIPLEPLDAEFMADEHQRPEVAVRSDYILVHVHVPTFNKTTKMTAGASLYCVVTEDGLYTLSYSTISPLKQLLEDWQENIEAREEYFSDGAASLLTYVISQIMHSSFSRVERLARYVDIAEEAVFKGNERKMVEEISVLTRDVIDFRKIVRPQRDLFSNIPQHPFISPETRVAWQRLHSQREKLWDMLDSLFESIKELRDTNNSLLQHKENQLLRLLTIYSIIAIPAFLVINPLDPYHGGGAIDIILFWGIFVLMIGSLIIIYIRFNRIKVL